MVYKVRIRRQENQKSDSYWQEFEFGGSENSSIAAVLNELNSRSPLTDACGNTAAPIGWECSCMVRKCGACAMLINGLPRLACSTFLNKKGRDFADKWQIPALFLSVFQIL